MKKAVLFGAGASRGSLKDFCIPIAAEFGECLARTCTDWKTLFPAIYQVVQHLSLDENSWSLESVWSCIDWYAKLQAAIPVKKPWENESPQMKKALLQVYGTRCDDKADRVRDESTIARLFIKEMEAGDVLISFNYDTIAERVAARCGHRLASALSPNDGGIRFAKPHGSTSWTLNPNTGEVLWAGLDGPPIVQSLRSVDVGQTREPLVLGAVPIKSELIREVQQACRAPDVFNVISTQWRIVVEAVQDADTLVVVGYSFPVEDHYGRFLMQEGVRRRQRKRDLRIEFFELEEKAPDRARDIFDVFRGCVHEIVYRGPVNA